jgi:hypothetical protein
VGSLGAPGTDCTVDGDFLPLPVKAFTDGLTEEIRSGVEKFEQRKTLNQTKKKK